ncbi:MAG TPA: MFS transporter [Streptosporangiaceae bacterium]|nr:MFS transporter [Streptosporangiaceae bacterium]
MAVRELTRNRLGLPDLGGRYQLAGALFTDSLGDGLFVPFAVVYFLHTTGLPLSLVGLGLSVASMLALPVAPIGGILIDRFSPAAVVIGGNLVSAVAFASYLAVDRLWQLIFFAFLAAAGNRFFWTGNLALVGEAFEGRERARWFAFQRAARNAGYGLGGLLAAAALGSGSGIGYRALAMANAVSFLLAATLVFRWSRRASASERNARRPVPEDESHGYRAALTDRPFLLLTAMNVLFVLCMMVLDVLLALYLVRVLHEPVWLSGLCFAANTVAVALCQTTVWGLFASRRPVRVLQLSAAVWGSSFLLMGLLAALPASLAVPGVFVAIAVYTIAELIQGPVFNGLVVAAAPEHLRGRYMAVYQLSWALAQAAAPGLFGWLFTVNHALPWIALAIGCACCVLILATRLGAMIGSL